MSKIEKIKEEIKRRKAMLVKGACSAQTQMETNCKEEAYNEILDFVYNLDKEEGWNPDVVREILVKMHVDTGLHKGRVSVCVSENGEPKKTWQLSERVASAAALNIIALNIIAIGILNKANEQIFELEEFTDTGSEGIIRQLETE